MRYIITHGHIFKNAGSTFDSALKKAFGNDFCDHRDDKSMRKGREDYLDEFIMDNPNLKAIASHHLCNPLPVSKHYTCLPVFFLRNPIERVVSVYNFEKKQPISSLGSKMAKKLSLVDYVKWRMQPDIPKVISNYQTAYIGSSQNLMPHEGVGLDIFNASVGRISNEAVFTGLVEQFAESFLALSEHLKKYFPDIEFNFKQTNVADSSKPEEKYIRALDLLRPVLPLLISENAYDLQLHNIALANLNRSLLNLES